MTSRSFARPRRASRAPRGLVAAASAALATALAAAPASAQSIIKNPGDHLNTVELEPHVLLVPFGTPGNDLGYGLGFRATVPIVSNGFVSSINNSVGIGFGVDWLHYGGCAKVRYAYGDYDCGAVNRFMFPVVMQWNFFLTPSWSVFGEPGLAFDYYSFSCPDYAYTDAKGRHVVAGDAYCPNYGHTRLDFVMFGGARWHFSHYTALTMRVGLAGIGTFGTGYFSVGVSFL